jgi:predicted HAD superfamily Cof-like phosphohydrolase
MRIFKAYKNKILPFLAKKANIMTLEQKQSELINLLTSQVVDLSMMSKIELGNDVTKEWSRLNQEISQMKSQPDYVPFVSEVEEFNAIMGKPNNYTPVIPDEKEWMFVYNFILEELEEYKHACETGDIVEVLDALCDITYVSLGNGAMLHGLKDKVWPAYQEVQASNLSKACTSEEEAQETVRVRSTEQEEPCHYEKVGGYYIVYRTRDRKVMKNVNYFRPDLTQFLK